jgi:glycogen(starch) synthase
MEKKADYLFEVSWEVCNKVGGIYTVVRSKAANLMSYYNNNYFLIGPYFQKKIVGEFMEKMPPEHLKPVCEKLKKEGIDCRFGTWLVEGNPNVILIEFTGIINRTNEIKKELWEWFKIDTLNSNFYDVDEPLVWAYSVGRALESMAVELKDKKIVAHFHEWLSGAGLLYLKKKKCNIATVFTTHATMLGRTIAGHERNLYELLGNIDPEKEAYNYGIQSKFHIERACANNSEVFTTVSEITGIESEKILGKKPDVLLPNGLDFSKFPTFEETSVKHRHFRSRIREFLLYYFFPYYHFAIEKTLIYFIASRLEFHSKGIDVFIKALAKLNERLKREGCEKTIIAFFWVPSNAKTIRQPLLESKTLYYRIKDSINENINDIEDRLLYSIVSEQKLTKERLFDEDLSTALKKKVLKLKKEGTPPISTHELYDEGADPIMRALRQYNLTNKEEDKVKVVYYPIYLTGADGLLNANYYESMLGTHLGVFPSYYEPWGYTPLEAATLGISSITTDLAGFGMYIEKSTKQKYPGIYVLKRYNKSDEDVVKELVDTFYAYSKLTKFGRIENKIAARKLASLADWKILIQHYIEAHNIALDRLKA